MALSMSAPPSSSSQRRLVRSGELGDEGEPEEAQADDERIGEDERLARGVVGDNQLHAEVVLAEQEHGEDGVRGADQRHHRAAQVGHLLGAEIVDQGEDEHHPSGVESGAPLGEVAGDQRADHEGSTPSNRRRLARLMRPEGQRTALIERAVTLEVVEVVPEHARGS